MQNTQPYSEQRLRDYAMWYYFWYFPSIARLKEKMLEKSHKNHDLVGKISTEMDHLFDEKNIIDSKIRLYRARNKNIRYISSKLREKKFEQILIDQKIWELKDMEVSLLSTDFMTRKIQEYISKHKSRQYIYSKLIERNEDKYQLEELLGELYTTEVEQEIVEYKVWLLKNKYDKQKIIEKLMRDGFSYGIIKDHI